MIELKKEFTKRGTMFQQVYKDDSVVIYRLSRRGVDNGKESVWYEVFKRLVMKPDIYHDDEFEKYPYDETFGKWAWSCSNINVVRRVLSDPVRGHFGMSVEEADDIISYL